VLPESKDISFSQESPLKLYCAEITQKPAGTKFITLIPGKPLSVVVYVDQELIIDVIVFIRRFVSRQQIKLDGKINHQLAENRTIQNWKAT